MNHELKAALEAAMANPKLAKKVLEVLELELKKAEAVEELAPEATLPEAVAAINEIIVALKAANLMA